MRSIRAIAVVTALFVGAIGASWAWFHVAPPVEAERLRLEVVEGIPGWQYRPEPISDIAMSILATTNLVNGVYTMPQGGRVLVFAADWRASDQRALSVVQHTPDICWVGAGMLPVGLGQPHRVALEVSGRSIPFECRVFATPDGGHRELVAWCTLLSGQVVEESMRWRVEEDLQSSRARRFEWAGRRLAASQWIHNVRARRPATGDKQFVRLSVPLAGDWSEGLVRIEDFASRWLHLASP